MRARSLAVLATVLLAAAVPAAAAAPAGATAQTGLAAYLAAEGPVQRSGFWGSSPGISDQQVISVGYTACDLHQRGLSDLQVLTEMLGYQPAAGTQAHDVGLQSVRNARRYICP